MNPGIYTLTAEQYHADPCPTASLSSSIASILLDQSPLHAWLAHPRLNPNFAREENSRFDLGSAAHMMLLERREDRIVRVQADDWRTRAAREARDAAYAEGKIPILDRNHSVLLSMCAGAQDYMQTTELGDMLATGTPEQSILWREGAMWCRARPDMLHADLPIILDYKSTASAAPDFIAKQIGRMGYDMQSEFYTRGMNAITGGDYRFIFLFQEITPPYACSLVSLSNAFREVGRLKVERALKLWERSITTDNWLGYDTRILYVEPRPWDTIEQEIASNQEEES